ncbi:MAG: type II secretion system GspH family protein [Turicibacter sp.]|nr:type II secretion system GspH family protein [Turicibacter sp.]
MKSINQQGYILTECLIGLVILSTIAMTLVQILPSLLVIKHDLEIEQQIYHKLYELKDQSFFYQKDITYPLTFSTPISYTVSQTEKTLCATYKRGDHSDKTICF